MGLTAFEASAVLGACLLVSLAAAAAARACLGAREEAFAALSARDDACSRLTPDAPPELVRACSTSAFGGSGGSGGSGGGGGGGGGARWAGQPRALSLDGVAACLGPCGPSETCGAVMPACLAAAEPRSPYMCEVTHAEAGPRDGAPFSPDAAPFRVFVAAAPGCLFSAPGRDGATFRDDPAALRLMLTFPEKLLAGGDASSEAAFPPSWSLTMKGHTGWAAGGSATFRLPAALPVPLAVEHGAPDPGEDGRPAPAAEVQAVSVYKASLAWGLRPSSPAGLANRLRAASAREPPRADGLPSDALYAAQPRTVSFTVTCRPGAGGLGSVAIKTLPPGAAQEGGFLTDEARVRVRTEMIDGKRDIRAATSAARWDVTARRPGEGGERLSPATGARIEPGSALWLCLTVDTWSGRVTDCREAVVGRGYVSVSRRRDPGIVMDLSSESPVEAVGETSVRLGIGSAREDLGL